MQNHSAHETGPIQRYPLHQPRPIQSWFRTHCNAQPRIPEKPAPAGMSPLRLRNFGRKTGVTGPIVKQEETKHPITDKMATIELPDFTRWDTVEVPELAEPKEPVQPLETVPQVAQLPAWLTALLVSDAEPSESPMPSAISPVLLKNDDWLVEEVPGTDPYAVRKPGIDNDDTVEAKAIMLEKHKQKGH